MLRFNVVPDQETLKDLKAYAKSLLREAVPQALAEKFQEENWLEERVKAALDRSKLEEFVNKWFSNACTWETQAFQGAIARQVESSARIWKRETAEMVRSLQDAAMKTAQAKVDSLITVADERYRALGEDKIRAIVREELRRLLVDKL